MSHSKPEVSVPEGLSALEYSRHIIEFELGWPQKSNTEMIADCIKGIASKKGLTLVKAYKYLARALVLAREQGIEINRLFFLDGAYMNVRPEKKSLNDYQLPSKEFLEATRREQQTPEFQAMRAKMDELLKKLCGEKGMK